MNLKISKSRIKFWYFNIWDWEPVWDGVNTSQARTNNTQHYWFGWEEIFTKIIGLLPPCPIICMLGLTYQPGVHGCIFPIRLGPIGEDKDFQVYVDKVKVKGKISF